MDLDEAARGRDPIEFLHHRAEDAEIGSDVLEDVPQQDHLEGVGVEVPWRGLDIEEAVGLTAGEFVEIEPAGQLVEPAPEIEFHVRARSKATSTG